MDTSVYALAAANLVGVQRIRWSSEEKKLEGQEVSKEKAEKAIANNPGKKVRKNNTVDFS